MSSIKRPFLEQNGSTRLPSLLLKRNEGHTTLSDE